MIKTIVTTFITLALSFCANTQNQNTQKLVGGPCEGCEAVFEYGGKKLTTTDTLPGFYEDGTKIKVEGTIFQNDGKTPAENVIMYMYHTNQEGIYAPRKNAKGWEKKHGYHRGWIKTDENGNYSFYTIKPASYPNRTEPAHIHLIILEPNGRYYWIEGCHFEGDSLLTEEEIKPDSPRGGTTGLLTLKNEGKLLVGTRDIILGRNIPGYASR